MKDSRLRRDSGQLVMRFRRLWRTSQKAASSFTSCGSLYENPTTATSSPGSIAGWPLELEGILELIVCVCVCVTWYQYVPSLWFPVVITVPALWFWWVLRIFLRVAVQGSIHTAHRSPYSDTGILHCHICAQKTEMLLSAPSVKSVKH